MHTTSSHLHYSGTDASRTRGHAFWALCVLLTALAFVAGAMISLVNAGPAPSPTPTEAPSLPGGSKPDKKIMDGTEKQGNNAGRNDNTKPTGSTTTKPK